MPDDFQQDPRPELEDAEPVLTQIGRLRPGSAVRKLALRLIQGREIGSVQPATAALTRPPGWLWNEKQVAAWALGRATLTEEEADAATTTLMETLERKRTFALWRRGILRPVVVSAAVGIFWAFMIKLMVYSWMPYPELAFRIGLVLGSLLIPVVAPASIFFDLYGNAKLRAEAAASLGQRGSPEAVGSLAEAIFDRNRRVREAATEALHQVLPTLTYDHFGTVGSESMRHLGRALTHPDTQLAFKVLEALEKVGTSHAIPYVQRSAERGRTVKFRDAAARVLETLKTRQSREDQQGRLLRPTFTPEAPASVLLRAARDTEQDPRLLLRANGSEDN